MTKLTRGGKIVVAVVIGLVVGGATALIVSLVGGGTPSAASVVSSNGYTVQSNSSAGISNTDPGDISSIAWGTQGQNAEIVVVTTSQGQAKESQVVNDFNTLLGGSGVTISTNGPVITIQGSDSAFAGLAGMGGL